MSVESTCLDYAAATPLEPLVLKAMQPYLTDLFANPSSPHAAGRQQRQALEAARGQIAELLGARPSEITLTGGSTEGINLAIQGVARAFPDGGMVATAVEHAAVLATVDGLAAANRPTSQAKVGTDGIIDLDDLEQAINDQTVLVAVQYANNETGAIQPMTRVAQLIKRRRADRQRRQLDRPLYLFCDAAQAGLLSLQVSRLGVDLLTMGGSKLYGPAGSGFLYVRTGVALKPVWFGGGQERGVRSGTQNVAAAVGLAAALQYMQTGREEEWRRLADLRDELWQRLQQDVSDLKLNGVIGKLLPGFLNIEVTAADGEELVARLDAAGLAVATGAACAAAHQEPSHVLRAMGRTSAQAGASLRLSLGRQTTQTQVETAAQTLARVIPRVRELASEPLA